jgi:hypothetical protein
MKVVSTYSTPAEAHVALSRLESAGIDAVIRDEFTVTFDWFYSNAIGGVKIEVVEEDETAAREILALPPSEDGLIHCPHCGSADSSVRVLSVFGAFCAFVGIPIPMTRAWVDCRSCKNTYDVPLNGQSDRPRP